ncbi:MAG TPA: hypothetical protein VFR81_12070 [Longimicrobium sp.]|nr:hypothetical protein [Longimicrobium sp.]
MPFPWQVTTHAVGEEDPTTTDPEGEEEIGPISQPGAEEEFQRTEYDDASGLENPFGAF